MVFSAHAPQIKVVPYRRNRIVGIYRRYLGAECKEERDSFLFSNAFLLHDFRLVYLLAWSYVSYGMGRILEQRDIQSNHEPAYQLCHLDGLLLGPHPWSYRLSPPLLPASLRERGAGVINR